MVPADERFAPDIREAQGGRSVRDAARMAQRHGGGAAHAPGWGFTVAVLLALIALPVAAVLFIAATPATQRLAAPCEFRAARSAEADPAARARRGAPHARNRNGDGVARHDVPVSGARAARPLCLCCRSPFRPISPRTATVSCWTTRARCRLRCASCSGGRRSTTTGSRASVRSEARCS